MIKARRWTNFPKSSSYSQKKAVALTTKISFLILNAMNYKVLRKYRGRSLVLHSGNRPIGVSEGWIHNVKVELADLGLASDRGKRVIIEER